MGEASDTADAITREAKLQNFVDGVFADPLVAELAAKLAVEREKSQAFFAALRESVRPGYVGDQHRTFVTELLKQAQTAGLYAPETE